MSDVATIGSLSNASDCIACQKRSRSFGNMLLKTLGLSRASEGVGQGKGSYCCGPTRRTAFQTDEAGVEPLANKAWNLTPAS